MEEEDLQKQVQEKLAQAAKLLKECVALAEEGGFEFSFDSPGNVYYPTTLFSDEAVLEYLGETSSSDDIDALPPEELEELIRDGREQMVADELPEYTELGHWWVPSRNC